MMTKEVMCHILKNETFKCLLATEIRANRIREEVVHG